MSDLKRCDHKKSSCPECGAWTGGMINVPAEPEQAGKAQRIELLVQVVEWLYERGHRDAAVDMDCNWNDAPPGDETYRRLTEYLPAPPTKEGT